VNITDDLISQWSKLFLPRESLPLSEWAEQYFHIPEGSAKTGLITLYAWQREPLDSFTDPRVQTIVLMCGVQMLKTLLMQIAMAYVIAEAPGPVLFSQFKDGDVRKFSKERLEPMLRSCPVLMGKVASGKRDTSNTIDYKRFPGGSLTLVGSLSPANFAGRSIRYYFGDEIDKYPASVGDEGDPVDLAIERTITYRSQRKIILACSPTIRGRSRIGRAYASSDQRRPWVPCPGCGEPQVLCWPQVKFNSGGSIAERADSARYECLKCAARWNDNDRWAACERSEWRAQKPFSGSAGFWISHLYSPWKPLSDVVAKHLEAMGSRERRMVWTNTTLSELWDEPGETPDYEVLYARREEFAFGLDCIVPMRVLFLTAAVDVQEDHLWLEVCGWGRGKERWSLAYEKIEVKGADGIPLRTTDGRVWQELDKILARDWPHESGQSLPIAVMTIDTGSRPRPVYDFALRHAQPGYGTAGIRVYAPRTVVPVKGSSSRDPQQVLMGASKDDAARKRGGVRIVTVGTVAVKQDIFDSIRRRPAAGPDPGAYRFPKYERFYFEQLCAERKIFHSDGAAEWKKLGANHALDCAVYNRAGAAVFGIDRMSEREWALLEARVSAPAATLSCPPSPRLPSARRPSGSDDSPDWFGNHGKDWF
jgi:phage terminase large subunit GpA-like protein